MDLSDNFTWEEMPTRDADTGYLTAAGWIPLIRTFSTRAAVMLILIHSVQSTIRMATNHETVFIAWYPFDWTVSPFYELVNISQVTFFRQNSHIRGGADKSLARLTSQCRRTESIVSLEREVCSCAELQVFSCYRGWKETCQVMRAISTTLRRESS